MTVIPREHWDFLADPHPVPRVECPLCKRGMLGPNAPHGIRSNGEVFQSVICANAGCTFHDYIRLDGWTYGEVPHR